MAFVFPSSQLYIWLTAGAVALFVLAALLRRLDVLRARRLNAFVRAELAPRLLIGYDAAVRRPLTWLSLLGFAFLGLALAQPHWGEAWQPVRQYSRDIMVCLDISESMNAIDIPPSRLERAKQKIAALLDAEPGDRFGLIAFAGGAALQCPLTLDHGYFQAVLDAVDTQSISLEGTDIGVALDEATKALRDEDENSDEASQDCRAIILISDGEQVDGDVIENAKEAAQYARLYVIGIGSPAGAEVKRPPWMARYMPRSDMSQVHISKLDEATLTQVALNGGGRYVRTTPDDFDVNQLTEHLSGISGRERETDLRFRLVNRFRWPLAMATLCLAGEGLWLAALPWLRRRRSRRVAAQGETQHA